MRPAFRAMKTFREDPAPSAPTWTSEPEVTEAAPERESAPRPLPPAPFSNQGMIRRLSGRSLDQRATPAALPPQALPPQAQRPTAQPPIQREIRPFSDEMPEDGIRSAARVGVQTPSSPLPFREQLEPLFGAHRLSHVKAHIGPEATASALSMNAAAYTSGSDVVFAGTPSLRTVAHEAAHVIQQQAGVKLLSNIGRSGDAYEQHAEAVSERVVRGQSAAELLSAGPVPASKVPVGDGAVQRLKWNELSPGEQERVRSDWKVIYSIAKRQKLTGAMDAEQFRLAFQEKEVDLPFLSARLRPPVEAEAMPKSSAPVSAFGRAPTLPEERLHASGGSFVRADPQGLFDLDIDPSSQTVTVNVRLRRSVHTDEDLGTEQLQAALREVEDFWSYGGRLFIIHKGNGRAYRLLLRAELTSGDDHHYQWGGTASTNAQVLRDSQALTSHPTAVSEDRLQRSLFHEFGHILGLGEEYREDDYLTSHRPLIERTFSPSYVKKVDKLVADQEQDVERVPVKDRTIMGKGEALMSHHYVGILNAFCRIMKEDIANWRVGMG